MKSKLIISAALLSFFALGSSAQGRILNILEANPDARSAAMGNTILGNTDRMHLYVNPSALVFSSQRLGVDFSTEMLPLTESGREMHYTLTAGYKVHPNRAIFGGLRYSGGLSILLPDGAVSGQTLRPYEWSADMGYAFGVTPEIVAYGSASFAQSYMGTKAQGMVFSVGMGYQKELPLSDHTSLLTLGVRLMDAGAPIKFDDTKLPYGLPTSLAAGGDWSILMKEHRLTYALSGRYFVPKGAKQLHLNTGLEYTYNDMISARVGYARAQQGIQNLTMGLGGRYAGVKLDVAYTHSLNSSTGVNTLLVGLGFDL